LFPGAGAGRWELFSGGAPDRAVLVDVVTGTGVDLRSLRINAITNAQFSPDGAYLIGWPITLPAPVVITTGPAPTARPIAGGKAVIYAMTADGEGIVAITHDGGATQLVAEGLDGSGSKVVYQQPGMAAGRFAAGGSKALLVDEAGVLAVDMASGTTRRIAPVPAVNEWLGTACSPTRPVCALATGIGGTKWGTVDLTAGTMGPIAAINGFQPSAPATGEFTAAGSPGSSLTTSIGILDVATAKAIVLPTTDEGGLIALSNGSVGDRFLVATRGRQSATSDLWLVDGVAGTAVSVAHGEITRGSLSSDGAAALVWVYAKGGSSMQLVDAASGLVTALPADWADAVFVGP